MDTFARIVAGLTVATAVLLVWVATALAGDYYVYACSSYGNTAPAFQPGTNADHLTPTNACMQPAPGGGYRTLELNNPPKGNAPVSHGYGANWTAYAPSGITIVGAYTPPNTVLVDCYLHADGFTAEYFWAGGTQSISYINDCNTSGGYGYGDGIYRSISPGSTYFGWGAGCWLKSSCSTSSSVGAVLGVRGVRLTAQENSSPSMVALGSNNLWYQAGRWVRGGGFPISLESGDASGVCDMRAWLDGQLLQGPATLPDQAVFDQCDPGGGAQVWPATVNTASYPNGQVPFTYQAANAAGVWSSVSETVSIDNTPVGLALSTPNDSDPNQWVNHAVRVDASASGGPSGVHTVCSTAAGRARGYPAGGITLNGTGVWTVSCRAYNNAIDVNGTPATSPRQAVAVKIDETPPSIAFEPQNPASPTRLVIDTSDGQSGVASGQIYMRSAAGGSWTALRTEFDGQHLLAGFDDAGLSGAYIFEATSCDNAGNCASTREQLALPVRLRSVSSVSLHRIEDPRRARVVYERVRVGWHWVTVRRHGKRVRVKRGGHFERIRVVRMVERCTRKVVRTGRHRWHERTVCRPPRLVLLSKMRVPFGHSVTVYGLLSTGQRVPISGAQVRILTAPDNQLGRFTQATAATTTTDGSWAVKLPPGPSRIIEAVYDGVPTILPAAGVARVIVPAKVLVTSITPNRTPWGGTIRISGRVLGGYVPASSKLLRLDIGVVGLSKIQGIPNIAPDGRYRTTYTFDSGDGVVRFWFMVSTLAEADFPFSAGHSRRVTVTVGAAAPRRRRLPAAAHHHRRAHRRRHHRRRRR